MKKSLWVENFLILLGKTPQKPLPEDFTSEARSIHENKKVNWKEFKIAKDKHRAEAVHSKKWKKRRWSFIIFINLLFLISYYFDIQILEGSLTGSRLIGFHLVDLNSTLQVLLAHKHIIANLLIGSGTLFFIWTLLGGRTFCSWVCPYHFISEWAEKIHLFLYNRRWALNIKFSRKVRTIVYLIFAILSYVTGYTIYETISPPGMVSRILIYGPGVSLIWVGFLLMFEIFFSRRAWCRYICPVGLTYGFVGSISPVRVTYDLKKCFHEADCKKVCMVPHVLDMVLKGRSVGEKMVIGPDCTRCGMCVDVCPSGALKFDIKGLSSLIEKKE